MKKKINTDSIDKVVDVLDDEIEKHCTYLIESNSVPTDDLLKLLTIRKELVAVKESLEEIKELADLKDNIKSLTGGE